MYACARVPSSHNQQEADGASHFDMGAVVMGDDDNDDDDNLGLGPQVGVCIFASRWRMEGRSSSG